MSLFCADDLYSKSVTGAEEVDSENIFKICKPDDTLKEIFGDLKQNTTIHFVTQGDWALHDMVRFCLMQTGPANLIGYSWSITHPAAEKLIKLKSDGLIQSMSFIFDAGMSRWSRGAASMLESNSEAMRMAMIHAKGFLIWNDAWKIAVVSSANFSNNPRIEAGVLSTQQEVFEFHKRWTDQMLNDGNPFEYDAEESGIDISTVPQSGRIVYLIRGLPGSGKSTLASSIADVVCEQDELFCKNGKYEFVKSEYALAKAHCMSKFKEAIADGVLKIAVANVFCDDKELDEYIRIAKKNGYQVFSIVTENRNDTKNIHGINENEIARMKNKFRVKL